MRRRDLLGSAVATAALAPFGAAAQPGLPVIGFLSSLSPQAEKLARPGFLQALEKTGFAVGQNVAIEYRFADGHPDLLLSLATELVGLPVTVLVATATPAGLAAKKATTAIPIVFSIGEDPVQVGLVASLNRPGGNATGVRSFVAHLGLNAWNCCAIWSHSLA